MVTKHSSPKRQPSITPVLLKQLSARLESLNTNQTTGRKRKRPLSSKVFALTSKRWKQLKDEEKAEKEEQKKGKKRGKQKQNANGKGKQKKCVDKENLENDDWNCNICNSSFFDEQKNEIASRWVQCTNCTSTSHVKCIDQLHQNLFSFESDSEEDYLCPVCFYMEPDDK